MNIIVFTSIMTDYHPALLISFTLLSLYFLSVCFILVSWLLLFETKEQEISDA